MTDYSGLLADLASLQECVSLDRGHRYKVDGKPMPNVTTIIRVLDAPMLDAWKVRVQVEGTARAAHQNPPVFGEPEEGYTARLLEIAKRQFEHERLSDAAADLGKQVHALIEHSVRQMLGQPSVEPEATEEARYVYAGWSEWAKAVGFKPLATEARVVNRTAGYCGTLDLLAIVDGRPSITDWKTSKAVYPEMRMQSAAYRIALHSMGWPALDGYVVRLPKDGGDIEMTALENGDALADTFSAFMSCLSLYRWMAQDRKVRAIKAAEVA